MEDRLSYKNKIATQEFNKRLAERNKVNTTLIPLNMAVSDGSSAVHLDRRIFSKNTITANAIKKIAALEQSVIKKNEALVATNEELEAAKAEIAALEKILSDKENYVSELLEECYADGLTGIGNRRFLDEKLKEFNNKSFSAIMIDIDHFKKFNDTYGHDAGDIVLKEVAKSIQETLRSNDIFARYGGEEFTILLPNQNLEASKFVAEKVRIAIQNLNITIKDKSKVNKVIKVTISLGIASNLSRPLHSAKTVIKIADKALYLSKNSGRDKSIEFPYKLGINNTNFSTYTRKK